MPGIHEERAAAPPAREGTFPSREAGIPDARRCEAPDWLAAGAFRLLCVAGPEGPSYPVRDALLHPALRGLAVDTLTPDEADRHLPALLDAHSVPGRFTVLVADLGPATPGWCRALPERFPGDHWHCLALADEAPADGRTAEDVFLTEFLGTAPRPAELASRLRYLARLATERVRRVAAEREALGIGERLNETQGKLRLTRVLEEAVERLQRLSTTDGLTGITNRARFEEVVDLEWGQAVDDGMPLSLILIDIDYFKRYNDSYGHLLGDACLQKVARSLLAARESSRDLVARYGGEEFVVLLPGRSLGSARAVAERLREGVEALAVPNANSGISPHVTISAGVASAVPDLTSSASGLVQAADRALYRAKREGRNRVAAE